MTVGLCIRVMKTIRAVVEGRYQEQLEHLGRMLGHTSVSQTINYILEGHLATEVQKANKYQEERQNG